MSDMEQAVIGVLRKYRVQKHYRASSVAKVTRYAVYGAGAEALTDPKPYGEANAEREQMVARAIIELFQ